MHPHGFEARYDPLSDAKLELLGGSRRERSHQGCAIDVERDARESAKRRDLVNASLKPVAR